MPYSTIVDGKVLDWSFKKVQDGQYGFYVGEEYMGSVFKIRKRSWSAVYREPMFIGSADGFGSRADAAEYLIKVSGIRDEKPKKGKHAKAFSKWIHESVWDCPTGLRRCIIEMDKYIKGLERIIGEKYDQ